MSIDDISKLDGLKRLDGKRYALSAAAPYESYVQLIELLSYAMLGFSLYDPRYPSPSDPGAYLDFFLRGPNDKDWRMTLGNHGWSGGAYIFSPGFVVDYLSSTVRNGSVGTIEVGTSGFRHYADEPARTPEISALLKKIHGF